MGDTTRETSQGSYVKAVLEGGPPSIPQSQRTQTVTPLDEKIKILHYGGYEHFERVGWTDEMSMAQQIIFRWTTRTEIAE
jgi:Family of unknown function (DUF5988)